MAINSLRRFLRSFGSDKGVAAVEFALIAPLMITTYLGSSELCNLLLSNRKVTNVTAATTDLVAQATSLSNAQMNDVFSAAAAIMDPFDTSSLQIVVTSVVADVNGVPKVAWSDGFNKGAYAVGSSYILPQGLVQAGGSVIVTEVYYHYVSQVADFWSSGFNVNDKFYQRPRKGAPVQRVS
jgi:Flp pilus assembly protein TadG